MEGSCLHLAVARVEPAVTAAEHGVRHDRTRLFVREVGVLLVCCDALCCALWRSVAHCAAPWCTVALCGAPWYRPQMGGVGVTRCWMYGAHSRAVTTAGLQPGHHILLVAVRSVASVSTL